MSNKKYTVSEFEEIMNTATWVHSYIPYAYDASGRWMPQDEDKRINKVYNFSWTDPDEHEGTYDTSIGAVSVEYFDFGGEGHGEDIEVVFKVEETGQLFKKTGYYRSYDGSAWDGELTEVKAAQRMVTVYPPI